MGTSVLKGSAALVFAGALLVLAGRGGLGPGTTNEDEKHRATLTASWIAGDAEDNYVGRITVKYQIGNGPVVTELALDRYRNFGFGRHGWQMVIEDYQPGARLAVQANKAGTIKLDLSTKIVAGGVLKVGTNNQKVGGKIVREGAKNFSRTDFPGPAANMWQ